MKIKELFSSNKSKLNDLRKVKPLKVPAKLDIIFAMDSYSYPEEAAQTIMNTFKQKYNDLNFYIEYDEILDELYLHIEIPVKSQSDIDKDYSLDHENIEKNRKVDFTKRTIITEIPSFPIKARTILLQPQSEITLQNINKFVDCQFLAISNAKYIKGNVLGILKIKSLSSLIIDDAAANEQWFDILLKHFRNDKNIIACQKELYDNDLDEYAEL